MHNDKRLWRVGERMNTAISFVVYVYTAASVALAALIGWASTTWDWYWATLHFAGVAIAFLLALMVFASTFFAIGLGRKLWRGDGNRRQSEATNDAPPAAPSVTVSRPTLQAGLYVCDIRMTFGDLENDRHSELTMRVFNGTGRVVELSGLSGNIKFSAPNSTDPSRIGDLPTPAVRPDMVQTVSELQEWFLILTQRVPAVEACKLLAMLNDNIPIHFDLSGLQIDVFAQDDQTKVERLPIWSGVSYSRNAGFGRIIHATLNIKL